MHATRDRFRLCAAVLTALLAGLPAGVLPAAAQCSYTTLTYSSPVTVTTDPTFLQFTQNTNYWSAVGIRPSIGMDWDIYLYSSPTSYPTCVTGLLAGSANASGTDIVIGDFNHSALGTYYLMADLWSGTDGGTLEWDDAADQIEVRGPLVERSLAPSEVIDVYDVLLEGGITYSFQFYPSWNNLKLLLFANPGATGYFASRNDAIFDVSGVTTWTAPTTDYYGLVVVKEDGSTGQYRLGVGYCSTPEPLVSGVVKTTGLAENYYQFEQTSSFWTAIGARGSSADWDVTVSSSVVGPGYPNCRVPELAASQCAPDTVDLVVGDFNFNTPGTFHSRAHMAGGVGSGAGAVEWDSGPDALVVNDWPVERTTGPADVLEVWDVWLTAGQSYTFSVWGTAGVKLLLFRNTEAGTYWAGRRAAQFETSTSMDYVAPASGYYGVVVVNDTGASGQYWVRFQTCVTPLTLAAGVATQASWAFNYYSFTPSDPYWTAVGARGPSDWDLVCYASPSGMPTPFCFSDWRASSGDVPPHQDLIVGDFNWNPFGSYYMMVGYGDPYATVQWDAGADAILVGGAPIQRSTDGSRVLEAWDVSLTAGNTYTIRFNTLGSAQHALFLFENPSAGPYWGGRFDAALVIEGGSVSVSYTPTYSGWHGVVVANENGASGVFDLSIDPGIVGVEASVPAVTRLEAVAPNPTRGVVRLDFALHEMGEVVLQVLDVSGRRVAEPLRSTRPAGRWSEVWDGRSLGGPRAAPGVYLVRMEVNGREVGRRRVILLD